MLLDRIIHEHIVNRLDWREMAEIADDVAIFPCRGVDEPCWHLARARQRFSERAFPSCRLCKASRGILSVALRPST